MTHPTTGKKYEVAFVPQGWSKISPAPGTRKPSVYFADRNSAEMAAQSWNDTHDDPVAVVYSA